MDARLRELERRAAHGDTDAQAALLAARVRCGDLERSKVELAAYLGHSAALKAAAEWKLEKPTSKIKRWLRMLCKIEPECMARIVILMHEAVGMDLKLKPLLNNERWPRYLGVDPNSDRDRRSMGRRLAVLAGAARGCLSTKSVDSHEVQLLAEDAATFNVSRASGYVWTRAPQCYVAEIVYGTVTHKTVEQAFEQTANFHSRFSKPRKQEAEEKLKNMITKELIAWALGAGKK